MRRIRRFFFFKTNYLNSSTDDKRSESKVQILKLEGQACRQHQQATNGLFILLRRYQPILSSLSFCLTVLFNYHTVHASIKTVSVVEGGSPCLTGYVACYF